MEERKDKKKEEKHYVEVDVRQHNERGRNESMK